MTLTDLLARLFGRGATPPVDPAPERPPADDPGLARTRFERMVEIAADGIISMDESHRIVLFNAGAEEIFGYHRDEVMGRPLAVLLPDRFRGAHREHVQRFAEGNLPARRMGERREISGLRKDGTEFPAEASISRLDTPEGRIFTVVIRDITDRKRAEETQRFLADASAVLARSLDYETTLAGLARIALPRLADWCTIDVVVDGGLRRIQVAHADAEIDPLAQRLMSYPPAPDRSHPAIAVVETGEAEMVGPVTTAFLDRVARDGEHRAILDRLGAEAVLVLPLTARNHTLGALTLVSSRPGRSFDEEDRLLAEELARRAAMAVDNARLYRESREAVAARDEVLGVVSHDLGNPLSAILVTTRVLERLVGAEAPEAVREQIRGMRTAASQMERLIRDLLEIRRIEAGQLHLAVRPEPVSSLVETAVSGMRPLAEERKIELTARVEAPSGARVLADPDRVQRVFSNLLGNALKFTPAGGRVNVVAEASDGDMEAGIVAFRVEDSGPGMTEEERSRVFDRFWQAGHQGSHGIGLGLAIARGLVEAHGGEIEVRSEPGAGSTFRFILPAAGGAAQPTTAASSAPT